MILQRFRAADFGGARRNAILYVKRRRFASGCRLTMFHVEPPLGTLGGFTWNTSVSWPRGSDSRTTVQSIVARHAAPVMTDSADLPRHVGARRDLPRARDPDVADQGARDAAIAECGGGMAANASVAAARLGAQVQYWGRVGDDALGDADPRRAARPKASTSAHVRRVPGCVSPSAAILVDARRRTPDLRLQRSRRSIAMPIVAAARRVSRSFDAVLADVRWPRGRCRRARSRRARAGKIARARRRRRTASRHCAI